MHDFPIRLRGVLAVASVSLLLTACGGGGGGGGAPAPAADPAPPTDPAPATDPAPSAGGGGPPAVTAADLLQAADPAKVLARAASVAESLPRFGSVVQSTNRDGSGVTTDAVSATLADDVLTVKIARQGASTLTIDTEDDVVGNNEATISAISVTRDVDVDATARYVAAAGYWLHFEGDIRSLDITDAEMGAFVVGPEFSGAPPDLPSMGTARYRGDVTGFYGNSVGTDFAGMARGSTVMADFDGVATLTADFSEGTVSGCIGCEGGLSFQGVFRDGSTGEAEDFEESSNASIRLGAIPIDTAAGTFRGEGVTVWNPDWPDTVRIVESEGRWGGRFSNIPEAGGDPRRIAGTFAWSGATAGGTRNTYFGAFLGR